MKTPPFGQPKNLPHIHEGAKILVSRDHVGSAVGVDILVHTVVLLLCASRNSTELCQRLLKLASVVVTSAGNARETEASVDSALGESVGRCRQGFDVGIAASGELGVSGASAESDECDSAQKLHVE